MTDDIAEGMTFRFQHLHAPGRPRRHLPDVFRREFRGCGEAVADIVVALAEDLQVGRQHQRRAFCRLGTTDEVQDEVAILHDVELEPERLLRHGGDVFDGADAHRRQREWNAEFLCRARRQHLAVGVLHAGEARRCQRYRHGGVLADHGRFQRTIGHIDENALAQLDLGEVRLVGVIGRFRPRTGIGVLEEHLRHAPLCELLQFGNGKRRGHSSLPSRGLCCGGFGVPYCRIDFIGFPAT
ncbi:hypothetical protein GA0061101_11958 [Rhizobium lusitanum]|uniref:Uncharacterized protein n=1 Tax=Rhizobium lusitanum TaxID=293958 RepID=A0A1C3WXB1_9HYPH|nr:hypothetical protein GA0061101_11958 [Rhizobium lusitanum]